MDQGVLYAYPLNLVKPVAFTAATCSTDLDHPDVVPLSKTHLYVTLDDSTDHMNLRGLYVDILLDSGASLTCSFSILAGRIEPCVSFNWPGGPIVHMTDGRHAKIDKKPVQLPVRVSISKL